MKNLNTLILILTTIFLCSCDANDNFTLNTESENINDLINVRLVQQNGSIKTLVSTEFLKEKWKKQSLEEGAIVEYEKFQILESLDEKTNKKYYFLKASNRDNTIETGAFISETSDGNEFELQDKQCTCKGCSNGCSLTVTGQICRCSSCFPSGTCEKTETIKLPEGD